MVENKTLTLVTGPSASGKGTRIIEAMSDIGEPVVLQREVLPYYPNFKKIEREVGRYFPERNLFFLGRHKKIGGWDSIDTLLNYRFMDIIEDSVKRNEKIIVDVNAAFLGPKLLENIVGDIPKDDITIVGFIHTDKEEMFRRLNGRRSNKVWNEDSYIGTNAHRANEKTSKLLDNDKFWSNIEDRRLFDAKEPKDFLKQIII